MFIDTSMCVCVYIYAYYEFFSDINNVQHKVYK